MFLLAVTHASSPRIWIVEGQHPAVRSRQRRDRPVVLVDDHVLAALGRAGVGDHALPPRQHRLALVRLEVEVARHVVDGDRLEPHRGKPVVDDQRPTLAHHRRVVEVVEVGHEDVAGGEVLRVGRHVRADHRRVQPRRRRVRVGVLRRVRAERRAVRASHREVEPHEPSQHQRDRGADLDPPCDRSLLADARQQREGQDRRDGGQAGADVVPEPESVGERLRYLRAVPDLMAGERRRERDQHREPEPAADLPRGVDEPRREPLLPLLGALRRGDRRRDDRHRDSGRDQHAGDDHVHDRAAARGDLREQQQPYGHHRQPGAEHGPHAEPRNQLSGTAGDEQDRQRHRQERQPRLQRRQPQHLLQVERAQVPHREQRGAEQDDDQVRVLQRLRQVLERDQRVGREPRFDHDERHQQHQSPDDRPERPASVPAEQTGLDDAVDEHHLARGERHGTRQVEALTRPAPAHVGHHPERDQRGDRRDRRVDQQNPAPADRLGDDPPEQGPRRAAEPVHRRPQADRAVKLWPGRERRGDDRQRRGGHERAAEALNPAGDDQHLLGLRATARQRRQPEQDQRGHEHTPLSEPVRGAATEHQEPRERDRVGVDHPLEIGRGEVEGRLDRRQRHVDDAQVEDHHELRDAANDQDPGRARPTRGLRRALPGRRRNLRRRGAGGTVAVAGLGPGYDPAAGCVAGAAALRSLPPC